MIVKIKGKIPRKKKKAFKKQMKTLSMAGFIIHHGDKIESVINSEGGDIKQWGSDNTYPKILEDVTYQETKDKLDSIL